MTAFGCVGLWAPSSPAAAVVQQWNHQVAHKWWFISPWEASERALALHLELHPWSLQIPPVPVRHELGIAMPKRRSVKKLRTSFSPTCELWLEHPDDQSWNRYDLHHGHVQQWTSSLYRDRVGENHVVDPLEMPVGTSHESPSMSATEFPAEASHVREAARGTSVEHEWPLWAEDLWDVLLTHGATELEEEGPIVYLDSHYIHHGHHPHNLASRALRLNNEWMEWEDQIRQVWADLILPEEFQVYVAMPRPPTTIYQGTVGTVLIVQSEQFDKTACLTTAILRSNPITETIETAHSLDRIESQINIFRWAQVERQCALLHQSGGPVCSLSIGSQPLPAGTHIRTFDGLSITIHVPREDELDVVDLMARSMNVQATSSTSPRSSTRDDTWFIPGQSQQHRLERLCSPQTASAGENIATISTDGSLDRHRSAASAHDSIPSPTSGWQAEVWELLQQHGHVDTDDDDTIIFVQSYYIDHSRHVHEDRPRPLRFDSDHSDWERQIRFIWEDIVDDSTPLEVVIVDPEPPVFAQRGTVATVIVHQHLAPARFACLITAVVPADPSLRILESAHSLEQGLSPYDLLHVAGVEHICRLRQEQGFGACSLHVGWRLLLHDVPVPLHHGLGIIIRVPIPLSDISPEINHPSHMQIGEQRSQRTIEPDLPDEAVQDPEDAHSLMARRPLPHRRPSSSTTSYTSSSSSTTIDWRQTVIFLLDGRAVSSSLPWHDSDELLVWAARSLDLPQSQVLRVQHISHRPGDFIQMDLQGLLLQRSNEFRPSPFVRIVLLDLELHVDNEVQPTPFSRRARWLPYATTRQALFRTLGLATIHQIHGAICHLWQNNVLIEDRNDVPLHIADGDYVKILVGELELQEDCASVEEDIINVTSHSASSSHEERPQTESEEFEYVNMLQYQTPFLRTHERQTGEQVAHTHRPCSHDNGLPVGCKVGEHDLVPPRQLETVEGDRAVPIVPAIPAIAEQPPIIQQLYSIWHMILATPIALDDPSLEVATWFLDFQIQPTCREPRPVHLRRDFTQWWNIIQAAWADIIDHLWPVNIYIVHPVPPVTRDFASARVHLIVVQRAIVHNFANIFTIVDSTEQPARTDFATFATQFVTKATIIEAAQYQHECELAVSDSRCMTWHADFELRGQVALRNRHGLSFVLIYNAPSDARSADPWQDVSDSDSLLQIYKNSQQRVSLNLADLVPQTTAVRIIDGSGRNSLPNPLEVEVPGGADQVRHELKKWGHDCCVQTCLEHKLFLCVHRDFVPEAGHHYVFAHDDPEDHPGIVLHSAPDELSEIQLLRFLCELDYSRAVILQHIALCDRWTFILFHHREPEVALPVDPVRSKSVWPAPSTSLSTSNPLLCLPQNAPSDKSTCELRTSFTCEDLAELFQSGLDVLVTDFEVLDLPAELRDQLALYPVCALDRTTRFFLTCLTSITYNLHISYLCLTYLRLLITT